MLPLTLRHVFDFGPDRDVVGPVLTNASAWDALRTRTAGAFALPADRAGWERAALSQRGLQDRAEAIDRWCTTAADSLASYGVGAAFLEYHLWRLTPGRPLILGEFAPESAQRLTSVFPEADVRMHDLRYDEPLEADVHLFHRIDTELSNPSWRAVFRRFAHCRVVMVAAEVIGARRARRELQERRQNEGLSRTGWIRNRAAFERLWRQTHRATPMRFHDLHAWDLRPR